MYFHRNKAKKSRIFTKDSIKRFLVIITICLFICPPTIYYFSSYKPEYPYKYSIFVKKWRFINTLKRPENINPDIKSIDIYPPKNITHNCNSKIYQCPKTVHGFFVCIHDVFQDEFISVDIKHNGVWQPLLSNFLIKILSDSPESTFIDIGSNIGYFSALAAFSHHYTIAIEPIPQNIELLYCTVVRNKLLDRITIISNPVADSHYQVTLRRGGSNQGDGIIEKGVKECSGACPPTSNTITLNDLTPLVNSQKNKHSVIMKIDAQGFEIKILKGGEKFFNDVNIICIVTEWELFRSNTTSRNIVIEALQLLHFHRFRPYHLNPNSLLSRPLPPNDWNKWPDDVAWFREDQNKNIITYS